MSEYSSLGPLREPIRRSFFDFLRQALRTDDGRRILADALVGLTDPSPLSSIESAVVTPYRELVMARPARTSPNRPAPLFITGRFRSGSTLLWNLFRHVAGCTSYYEPLNERRWFDRSARGERVDRTHLGVTDYWREYDGLEHLSRWYNERWIDRRLYMNGDAWDPDLQAYIEALVSAASGRAVLQFNRVDFRLPWLRRHFPEARIIHLYRHPRDQWCSSLVELANFPSTATMTDFESRDHFYLLPWARDLSYVFPFLDPRRAEHPYELFYYLWKLSYIFGQTYGHGSFALETLCASPDVELQRLMDVAQITDFDREQLRQLIVPQPSGKWRAYANQDWFEEREAKCETVLLRLFSN